MADLDDVVDAVNELEGTVRELKHAVQTRPSFAHAAVAMVCAVLLWVVVGSWIRDLWNSKFFLSLRYNFPTSQITIEEKPHDCDFLQVPLGGKGCSYVRDIEEVRTGTNSSGEHLVTYDGGKTWTHIDDPNQIKTGVFVVWTKR
jgi:hypothetical protein